MPVPVIVYGNPCDGITIIGPFASTRSAEEWAKTRLDNSDGDYSWSTPLFSPEEFLKTKTERIKSNVINKVARRSRSKIFEKKQLFVAERCQSMRLFEVFSFKRFRRANPA